MTEPPPWNDPIKPPNGNFSLEERKWREGITRALKNMKIESLGDIGDVDLTSPSAGQILKFDGTNWVNGSPSTTTVNWGDIAGTLSDQTDLKNALDAKQDISGLAAVALSGSYTDLTDIPALPSDTDLSHYNNTTSNFATVSQIPTDVSELNNDAGYITSAALPTVNDATLTLQKNGTTLDTFTANASSNVTINFTVPTDTNDLTNSAGFITGIANLDDIGDVVISSPQDGQLLKYDAISGNWINGSGSSVTVTWNDITGKPTFATVATSGDYGDLLNTPTMGDLSSSSASYITVTGGTGAVIGSGASISFTDTNLAKLDANNVFTGATNTFKALSLAGNVSISQDNTYEIGGSGARFLRVWSRIFKMGDHCHMYTNDHNRIAFEWYNSGASASRTLLLINDDIYCYNLNKKVNLGTSSQLWKAVYSNVYYVGGGDALIANVTTSDTVSLQLQWKNGSSSRAVYCETNYFKPYASNTVYCGHPDNPWKAVYSNTGTIQPSDRTLKDDIKEVGSGLDVINKLGIYSYTLKNDGDKKTLYSIIAQDALDVAPDLIDVPDGYKKGDSTLGVYVSNVLFLAVRAIQELSEKVKKLEVDDGTYTKDK